ncbi:MAG TPA: hypothetical protein VHC69_28720 [Polyangiaceae bacterium]|nr:hypothetical protein [Polyangiaceae bacterium]
MTATTTSSPPPGPLHESLARAASISRFFAALLVAAVSARFAVAGFQRAFGTASSPSPSSSASGAPHAAPLVRPKTAPSQAVLRAPGPPRSIQLGVSAGPARSEIYVNGRLLGNTPFVGDTSCKTGMPLKIELVPSIGPPLVYERECRGTMIEISGPPP